MGHCYEARDYDLLNSSITLLSKKHGQLKAAVQAIVELSMGWLVEIKKADGVKRWLELVETLRGVTEGKVRADTHAGAWLWAHLSVRSFWKHLEHALLYSWRTTMKSCRRPRRAQQHRPTRHYKPLRTSSRTSKSKLTLQWSGERRRSLSWNK